VVLLPLYLYHKHINQNTDAELPHAKLNNSNNNKMIIGFQQQLSSLDNNKCTTNAPAFMERRTAETVYKIRDFLVMSSRC